MNQKFEDTIKNRKRFNGKPFQHWQDLADELVIENLVRAAGQTDERSLVGYLAHKRLMELAEAENPTLFQRVLAQRDRCHAGFRNIMQEILS